MGDVAIRIPLGIGNYILCIKRSTDCHVGLAASSQ